MQTSLFKRSHKLISEIYEEAAKELKEIVDKVFTVNGWVSSFKPQAQILFVQMYDGSHPTPFQIVFPEKDIELQNKIKKDINIGACISVTGKIIKSPAKGQLIEMVPTDAEILGTISDPAKYLPGIKKVTLELLRKNQHLKSKFASCRSVYRIRSRLMQLFHEKFRELKMLCIDPNIVTTADCEGAGETFNITTLLKDNDVSKIPTLPNSTKIDYSKDFFCEPTFLTVSSQLQLETLVAGMNGVYTTNPSFRAEQSKTSRHLACFTHVEWEIAFVKLSDLMDFSEDLVVYCISNILKDCKDDIDALNSFVSKGLKNKLTSFVKDRFERISYDQAIDIIHKHKDEILKKYQSEISSVPNWGDDLGSYCEKFIAEVIYKKPVFVFNYPRDLKSFYMKQNPPYEVKHQDGKIETRHTVQGCDLLIPGLGELIGSSIRENNYDKLIDEMDRRKMDKDNLHWYTKLRKDGSTPTGGAGLGFDRLVTICCFTEFSNIRDAVPFPVAYQECEY